jgi:hypothetical protein
MNTTNKTILGIVTILPFLFFILFIVKIFSLVSYAIANGENTNAGELFFSQIAPMIIYIILFSLLSLGLLIYYIIHAVNNQAIESTERIVWILLFVFFGIIVFPVYWGVRIWKG